jgi:hypothetical protein
VGIEMNGSVDYKENAYHLKVRENRIMIPADEVRVAIEKIRKLEFDTDTHDCLPWYLYLKKELKL